MRQRCNACEQGIGNVAMRVPHALFAGSLLMRSDGVEARRFPGKVNALSENIQEMKISSETSNRHVW